MIRLMRRASEAPPGVGTRVLHVLISLDDSRGGPISVVQRLQAMDNDFAYPSAVISTNLGGASAGDWQHALVFKPSRRFPRFHLSWPLIRSLWRSVRRCDLVQVHEIFALPPLAAMVFASVLGRPYVLWPHGSLDPVDLEKHRVTKRLMSPFLRVLISRAQEVWVVGPGEGARAVLFGARTPVRVVSPVVAPALEDGPDDACSGPNRIVLFMGRLHPIKQLENLIDAFGQASMPREQLVICGAGAPAYQGSLMKRAKEVPHGERITFVGWAQGRKKWRWLRDADLVVLPSRRESFGFVVVEALAVGTPVLTTTGVPALSCDRELTYRCGPGVPALAAAIRCALDDPELAARGAAGRDFVKKTFTLDAAGQTYREAVKGVANKS